MEVELATFVEVDVDASAVDPDAYTAFKERADIDASVDIQQHVVNIIGESVVYEPPEVDVSNDPAVFTASSYGWFENHFLLEELSSLGAHIVLCEEDREGRSFFTRTEYLYGQSWGEGIGGTEIFDQLAKRSRAIVKAAQKAGQSTTARELTRLAKHDNYRIRIIVAGNPNTPADVLLQLATDENESVRAAVMANPSTSSEVAAAAALH